MDQRVPLLLAIGVVVFIFMMEHHKPVEVKGMVPVTTTTDTHFSRDTKEMDSDADFTLTDNANGDSAHFSLYDGDFLQSQDQLNLRLPNGQPHYTSTWVYHQYLQDWRWDIGAFTGVVNSNSGGWRGNPIEGGLRLSPARFIDGVVSPDFLISGRGAGVGAGFFPPVLLVGRRWRHVGLGVGHEWSYRSGTGANLLYLEFSTRYP